MTDLTKLHIVISVTVDQSGLHIHPKYLVPSKVLAARYRAYHTDSETLEEQATQTRTIRQQLRDEGLCFNGRTHGLAVRGGRCQCCLDKKKANDRQRNAA